MTAAVGCSGGSGGGSGGEQKVMTFVAARAPDEPIGLLDRLGGSKAYTDLAGDVLMTLDPKNGELQPQLATKWEQTSPSDWTFTLREGVKFHNGEDFNAEAAAWNIQKQTEPDSPARVVRYAQGLTASSDGPTTLKVHCPSACPILDLIAPQFQFEAPKWAQENPEEAKDTPMGTGPFYLADRVDGQYLLYKKFDQYRGKTGYFDEVKIVWREEPSVRASMVSTGEAQLTEDLDPALISKVPKVFTPTPVDYAWIRLRDRDAEGNLDPIRATSDSGKHWRTRSIAQRWCAYSSTTRRNARRSRLTLRPLARSTVSDPASTTRRRRVSCSIRCSDPVSNSTTCRSTQRPVTSRSFRPRPS